jgi:hypothetical protein
MPRLKALVASERSKKRAAMRSAPTRSPAAHAKRILSVFVAGITSTALYDARETSSGTDHWTRACKCAAKCSW